MLASESQYTYQLDAGDNEARIERGSWDPASERVRGRPSGRSPPELILVGASGFEPPPPWSQRGQEFAVMSVLFRVSHRSRRAPLDAHWSG